MDTRKISEDDWREVHVTTCKRMAAGYTEPGPGRLRHAELLDVDPDSAPLMFFLRFLPKKAVSDILKLTDERGKQMHRPTWSMELGDFYTCARVHARTHTPIYTHKHTNTHTCMHGHHAS